MTTDNAMPGQLTEDTPVPITMLVREWNQILGFLSEQPFRVVAPLIGKIHGQAMNFGRPPPAPPIANGAAIEGAGDGLSN